MAFPCYTEIFILTELRVKLLMGVVFVACFSVNFTLRSFR
jgi:hypothetical protein